MGRNPDCNQGLASQPVCIQPSSQSRTYSKSCVAYTPCTSCVAACLKYNETMMLLMYQLLYRCCIVLMSVDVLLYVRTPPIRAGCRRGGLRSQVLRFNSSCIVLYPYCIVLFCIVLCCVVLYCVALRMEHSTAVKAVLYRVHFFPCHLFMSLWK